MSFDEKQLRGFLAVVDSGSIGSAAGLMKMSQPTLSRLIRGLEERHGVALFQRLTTGVTLTDAGEALLPHARLLMFEMEQAADTLRAVRGLRRGVVRVGGISASIQPIIVPAVALLREVAPQLRVEVLDALDNRLLAALTGNVIDLMVAAHLETSDEVRKIGQCQFEDIYDVFCAAGHDLAGRHSVATHDILPGQWVMPPAAATPRVLFDEIVRSNDLPKPNVVVETTSPQVIVSSVIQAGLLGWLPGPLHAHEVASGLVTRLPIPEFRLQRRFFLYRRARGLLPAAAQQFCSLVPFHGASV